MPNPTLHPLRFVVVWLPGTLTYASKTSAISYLTPWNFLNKHSHDLGSCVFCKWQRFTKFSIGVRDSILPTAYMAVTLLKKRFPLVTRSSKRWWQQTWYGKYMVSLGLVWLVGAAAVASRQGSSLTVKGKLGLPETRFGSAGACAQPWHHHHFTLPLSRKQQQQQQYHHQEVIAVAPTNWVSHSCLYIMLLHIQSCFLWHNGPSVEEASL